jgi:hypothetical protein
MSLCAPSGRARGVRRVRTLLTVAWVTAATMCAPQLIVWHVVRPFAPPHDNWHQCVQVRIESDGNVRMCGTGVGHNARRQFDIVTRSRVDAQHLQHLSFSMRLLASNQHLFNQLCDTVDLAVQTRSSAE